MALHPETLKRLDRLHRERKTRKRKATEDKGAALKRVKEERRRRVVEEATLREAENEGITEGDRDAAIMLTTMGEDSS